MSQLPPVPLLDLQAQHAAIRDEITEAVREVVESQHFILGPTVQRLEEEIADYCQSRHAIGCASGSDALLLSLMAVDVGPGDEVICPAYTFFATAGSIARLGAVPVFADIDPVTYNLDPELVRRRAKSCRRLKAIMPVHLFGQAVDLDAFLALGEQFGVPVIEDAAQAIGTRDGSGCPVGSRGTVGCFSFYPTKNLGGYGDGGLITTNDADIAEKLRMLRVHGSPSRYEHQLLGMNSRLDALQAAVLRVKLRHLESWHTGRRRHAKEYDRAFSAAGARTSATPWKEEGFPIRTPHRADKPARHIYNQYVIRVPDEHRDALREHLRESGIGTEIYYPKPMHLQACFANLGGQEGDLPESEAAARQTLALPIYPELTEEQIGRVSDTVISYLTPRVMVRS